MKLKICALLAVLAVGCTTVPAPEPYGAVPSERQLDWHKLKYYAFIHFSPNTFTDKEWGYGDESPQSFNPSELDIDQWARVASEAGMEGIVITAKHHDGFALWPSKYTEHSVKNSPWKNGEGDILRELRIACDKYGLKLGMYLSPWDRNHPEYGTSEYITYFRNQLKEVLTEYGDIYEVWFDGANGGDGYYGGANETRRIDNKTYYDWENTRKIVRELQPSAVMFSDAGPDIRWIGNEQGYAADPNWSTMKGENFYPGMSGINDQLQSGHEDGNLWVSAEVNTSIRPGWFYHEAENDRVKSVNQLIDNWYHSVGMNGNFILNLPPDKRGLIHENDIKALQGLKAYVDKAFSTDYSDDAVISASNVRGNASNYDAENAFDADEETYWATDDAVLDAFVEVDFGKEIDVNVLLLQEYIRLGQRIKGFRIEAFLDGAYSEIAQGITIGNRRLIKFKTIKTSKLKIHFHGKASPVISNVEIYRVPEMIGKPAIQRGKDGLVKITSDSRDPSYRYTTDGSEPNTNSSLYSAPFALNKPGKIRAKAFLQDGTTVSETVTADFDVPKTLWEVTATKNSHPYYPINNAVDGDHESVWFTEKGQDKNVESSITVDFGELLELKGFSYLPRQDGRNEANVFKYNLAVSTDGKRWNTILQGKEFSNIGNNPVLQKVEFGRTVSAKYLKLTCISDIHDEGWMNIAELDVVTNK